MITLTSFSQSYFKTVFQACGKGAMRRKFPYLDFYFSVQTRMEYLQKAQSFIRKDEENGFKPQSYNSDWLSRSVLLNQHLTFCRETIARLDINNTIDHLNNKRSEQDADWVLDELEDYWTDWKDYLNEYPIYVLDAYFGFPRKESYRDRAAQYLEKMTYAVRRAEYLQRLKSEVTLRHSQGWFFVFDTLTLAPEDLVDFYNNPNAIRDYCRSIGRLVNRACGRRAKDSYQDVYKYFLVPEYGDANGRLHFHCLHMMRSLPIGTCDPAASINLKGEYTRHRRELSTFKGIWPYGMTAPISVRYQSDAYTVRLKWIMPLDKKTNRAIELRPVDAVIAYIAKYVSKNISGAERTKLNRNKSKWRKTLQTNHKDRVFRVRMSRNFGMDLAPMSHLSMDSLMELTNLHWKASPINVLLKRSARVELLSRMVNVTLHETILSLPVQINMLKYLRCMMTRTQTFNPLNSTLSTPPKFGIMDISDETREFMQVNDYLARPKSRFSITFGAK